MFIDLHVHSKYSSDGDGDASPERLIRMAQKLGLGGIAVTDHNEVEGSKKAFSLASSIKDFIVIRGTEVTCSEGHILAYGVDSKVPKDMSPVETVEKIEELGGIAVCAHPFRLGTGVGRKVASDTRFSAIEVLNNRCTASENRRALRLAEALKVGCTGGSDCHEVDNVGKGLTEMETETYNEPDILEEIRKGNTLGCGESRDMKGTIKYFYRTTTLWMKRGMRRI